MRNLNWFRWRSCCLIAVTATSLGITTLLAGASLAFGSGQEPALQSQEPLAPNVISGVVTDSRCRAKHASDSGKNSAECTRACVRHGAKYILLNGGTAYVLLGNRATLDKFAGQRVRIGGVLDGDTLRVQSVMPE